MRNSGGSYIMFRLWRLARVERETLEWKNLKGRPHISEGNMWLISYTKLVLQPKWSHTREQTAFVPR